MMQDVLRAELVWVLLTGDSEDRFQWCGSGEERWTLVEAQLATDPPMAFRQMPASGAASWQAAPPVPWPWPWPSQRMW